MHPDDRKLQLRNFRARMRGSTCRHIKRDIDKSEIYIGRDKRNCITFKQENAVLSLVTDVTERIRSETSLKSGRRKYLHWLSIPVRDIVSQDGIRKFVNRKYADTLGYTPDELVDRPITDVIILTIVNHLYSISKTAQGEVVQTVEVRLVDKAATSNGRDSGGLIDWKEDRRS